MSSSRTSVDTQRRSATWDTSTGRGNYLSLVVAQAASTLLAFAGLWIATKTLGPDGYGGIVAVIAASQLFGQVTIQWTAIALFRHGCQEFVETGSIASSFWNRLFILAANLALVLLSAPFWLAPLTSWLSIPTGGEALLLAHLTSTALAVHILNSLQAAKLPRFQSILLTLEKASLVALLLLLVASGRAAWWSVASVYALVPVLTVIVGLVRVRSLVHPRPRFDPKLATSMLRFSFPLMLYSIVGYLATNHLDAFFILNFLSPAALGLYALAYQLAGSFMQLPSLAGSLFMAYFITSSTPNEAERLGHFFRQMLPALTVMWSIACGAAAICGSTLFGVLFDASFHQSRSLVWPLMAAAALAGPVMIAFGPLANARSRTSIPATAAAAAALLNVRLNLALIPRFGLLGCAWATTVSFGASLLVCALLVSRLETVPIRETLLAATPAVVGASAATIGGDWMGLAATVACGATLGVRHREALRELLPARETVMLLLKRAQPGTQP